MAPNDSATSTPAPDARRRPGRLAARYGVPVAVIGVAAATIGLVPALAAGGDPDLPEVTAQELVEKIAASETDQFSGTVKVSVDLGLPSFGGLDLGELAGSLGDEGKDGKGGATATPEEKLTSLASGTHTLRVAGDGPDRQKLTFVDGADEYSLIRDGDQAWAYDSSTGEALHTGAAGKAGSKGDHPADDHVSGMSPKELATKALDAADETTRVTVDGTTTVAGRDAYRLALTPKDSGSTVKAVRIAVDAETGTPLKFTVAPSDGGKAIVDAGFSKIDYTRPSAGTFAPPKDAKITESKELAPGDAAPGKEAPGKDAKGDAHAKAPKDAEEALNSLPAPLAGLASAEDTEIHGKGWASVAELTFPKGEGLPAAGSGSEAPGGLSLDSLGKKAKGDFGTGTLFSTRVVNALVTEDGRAFVGAVTPEKLVEVAGK